MGFQMRHSFDSRWAQELESCVLHAAPEAFLMSFVHELELSVFSCDTPLIAVGSKSSNLAYCMRRLNLLDVVGHSWEDMLTSRNARC